MATSPSSPATDELDRLFLQLIRNLAELDPSRVHGPVEVAELYQKLVPYRTHRTHLGLDTNQDYEMTVLRLLAGERSYALLEPAEARAAIQKEIAGVNPDPGFFKRFGNARVTFDPGQVRAALGGLEVPVGDDSAEPEPVIELPAAVEAPGEPVQPPPEEGAAPGVPFALDEEPPALSPRTTSAPCSYCGGELPIGRAVIYCPHCGQNVGVVHCPACGTELDFGWRFCITCGRTMSA